MGSRVYSPLMISCITLSLSSAAAFVISLSLRDQSTPSARAHSLTINLAWSAIESCKSAYKKPHILSLFSIKACESARKKDNCIHQITFESCPWFQNESQAQTLGMGRHCTPRGIIGCAGLEQTRNDAMENQKELCGGEANGHELG